MFRSIKEPLLRCGERVADQLQQRQGVDEVVFHCLHELLGVEYARQITVQIGNDSRELILSTPRKALAGQLVLYTTDIRASLAVAGIAVKRIVIR